MKAQEKTESDSPTEQGTGTSRPEGGKTENAAGSAKAKQEEGNEAAEQEQEQDIVVEQPLFTIKEVFVYRVPPLRASSGHRAEEWGLANPVFTGVLKMAQVGNSCCLRLFKPPPEGELGASPELFAECEVHLDNGRTVQVYVESVIDSSRYFVLRCEDKASGRHAYVGIGFRERSSAFDFKAVLDDFVRFLDRQKRAEETSAVEEAEGEEGNLGPVKQMKDLSIAEGQKVHIGLKVAPNGGSRARRRQRSDATKAGGGLLLPPPPLPGATYKATAVAAEVDSPPVTTSPTSASSPSSPLSVKPPDATSTLEPHARPPPDGSPPKGVGGPVQGAPGEAAGGQAVVGDGAAVELDAGREAMAGAEMGAVVVEDNSFGIGGDAVGDGEDDGWGEFESA